MTLPNRYVTWKKFKFINYNKIIGDQIYQKQIK